MSNKFIENAKKIAEEEFPETPDRIAKMFESELSKHELAKMLALYVVYQYYPLGPFNVVGTEELFANDVNAKDQNFDA